MTARRGSPGTREVVAREPAEEDLFERLVRAAARAQFVATLDRYGLTSERRRELLRRFEEST